MKPEWSTIIEKDDEGWRIERHRGGSAVVVFKQSPTPMQAVMPPGECSRVDIRSL